MNNFKIMGKRKILLLFVLSFILIENTFGYENQGFILFNKSVQTSFDELIEINEIKCNKLCFINLRDFKNNDEITFSGNFAGTGTLGLGVMASNKVSQLLNINLNGTTKLNEKYNLSQQPFYTQLPKGAEIVLFFTGEIYSTNFIYNGDIIGFLDQLLYDINSNESLTPYSINLRYGSKILGIPVLQVLYILFILLGVILYISKKIKKNTLLYIMLVLFLLVAVKNMYDYSRMYFNGVNNFYMTQDNKNFHNLGDYYDVTTNFREKMGIDTISTTANQCTYYAECAQDWPFCYHWRASFMKPCTSVKDVKKAEYILLYKKNISEELQDKTILHSQDNSYLLKN